jgi:hypothetical protein
MDIKREYGRRYRHEHVQGRKHGHGNVFGHSRIPVSEIDRKVNQISDITSNFTPFSLISEALISRLVSYRLS